MVFDRRSACRVSRALLCLLLLPTTTVSLVHAQPEPGTLGLYLDPAGQVAIDGWRPGGFQHDDLWDFDESGAVIYTVHVLGLDLPDEIQTYAFGLQPYEFTARFSDEQFPPGSTWEHWTTPTSGSYSLGQTNYQVDLTDCIPSEGLIELARIEVRIPFFYWSPVVVLCEALDPPNATPLGYLVCGNPGPFGPWTAFEISEPWAGVAFPDAAEASSWGEVKALYRR